MMKKLLLFFMMLAMAVPLWAGLQTVTINRNDGQFEEANGVYYCYKSGLMMTFTSGLNNPNYLVEHQQVYFEVRSVNPEYIIKKIVFHCVDNTTSDNLDCFYWGPSTISIVQNFYNQSAPGTYRYSGYTGTWTGETNHIQFTTMAKPVRFGSVDITFEKETGDIFELVTDESQLQAGHKYAIVNQYYGYAMSTFMNETYNTTGRTKVSFVPETNKHKVIINDETRIVTLQNGTGVDDRPWFINGGSNTSLKRAGAVSGGATSTYGHVLSFERYSTSSYKEYFPVKIEIGQEADNYPALIRFTSAAGNYSSTDTEYAIGHNNSYSYFKTLRYTGNNANTYSTYQRVFLYQPAQNYIITTERIPTGGGEITLTDGVLEVNGDMTSQESQQVSFYVGINEGYTVESVTVTDAGNNTIPVECTHQTLQGNNYTFTMPGANVHIVVRYTQANYHVIHAECTPTYGGEYTFNSGTFDMSDQVVSFADNTVNFGITASLGYVFTGITATSEDGQSTVLPLTDNGDGTYSFTMPDNDVTLSASFDRVIGDIFDLVTSGSQIVEGSTYIIVTQNHDKVMKHWNKTDGTFQGAPIVEWVTQDKSKVRVDDNACFFRMDDLVVNSSNNYRSAYMNTLVGYLGYGDYDGTTGKVIATPDRSGYNRATMYISAASNASNYLCTFDSIKTADRTIRYEEATNSFKIINYGNSTDERVWLYKLAESYHNISTVCTPPEGGRINVNASSAQAGETVTFTVTTNPGYTFDSVTVTYTDGSTSTITVTENDGTYSFTMPDNAVTIAAGFTVIPVGYVIDSERIPEAGGYVNINNSGNNATANAMPGETVNVYVGTNWGYRIASVTAVNTTSGETVTLTTGATSDAGNNYSFTMPVGNVHITAKFYKNLLLLGTVMGRTTWCPAGPEFTFDEENDLYYLDVYFKGISQSDPYGYFNLATATDNVDWTNRNLTDGNWGNVQGRLFAESPNMLVGNGSVATLYGDNDHYDRSFKIPAGVYRITVNHDLNQMTITQTNLTMTFDPVSGSSVQVGSDVHITSDLQSIVHALAERYGMHDNNGGPSEDNATFYTTTDNWAHQVEQEEAGLVTITQIGTTTVKSSAAIGQIIVNGEAVYTIVPVSYTIDAIWSPENAGTVTVAPSANEGQTVTVTVAANSGYSLTSLTVTNSGTGASISYTNNGDGTYTFTMPANNVVIMANFSLIQYGIFTSCTPPEGGSIDCDVSTSVPGEDVTFTVDTNPGYVLQSVTMTVDGQATTITPDGNGVYSFVMPNDNVYITANFELAAYNITTVCDPVGAGEFHDVMASATAGTAVNFTVSATDGYELDNVTLTVGDQVTTLTPDENGYYSFTMPEGNVTVTAYFLTPLQLIEHPDGPEGGSPVTVADELIGTWAAKHLLWAKDQAPQVSNDYVTIPDLQDYARQNFSVQPGKKFQSKEWDQSNWVILDFSTIPGWDKDNDYAEVSKYVDHKIDAGTITGQYECIVGETNAGDEYKVQHVIHLSAWPTCLNPTDPTSLGYPGYVGDPREEMTEYDYMYNHYLPANFMGDYIGGVFGHVPEGGVEAPNDPNVNLFFMNPKDREVAQLWGVWLGEMEFHNEYNPENRVITGDVFTVYKYNPENPGVNSYGLKGAIWVPQDEGWLYNRIAADNVDESFGEPTGNNELKTGAAYLFHAAITMQAFPYNGPLLAPRRDSENPQDSAVPDDEYWPWSHYMVYPLDLQSHNNNFTAVTEVRTRESIQIESIRYYNVMGQESRTPFDGINIEVIRYKDGSSISRKILR